MLGDNFTEQGEITYHRSELWLV